MHKLHASTRIEQLRPVSICTLFNWKFHFIIRIRNIRNLLNTLETNLKMLPFLIFKVPEPLFRINTVIGLRKTFLIF